MKTLKLANFLRKITAPPFEALVFVIALYIRKRELFHSPYEAATAALCLAVIPFSVYAFRLPREKQRSFAMIVSSAGYIALFALGLIMHSERTLICIYLMYVLSVAVLLVFNKLLKVRASGHACAITGPALILCALVGGWWYPVCILGYCATLWASVKTNRHTAREFLLGSAAYLMAAAIALIAVHP